MKPAAGILFVLVVVSVTAGCVSEPTLETFLIDTAPCYDRSVQPQTAVVDTHLHFRPFGGPAVPFEETVSYLRETGVLFANISGIGQMLPTSSSCTYYLDCPGTPVEPSLKNDFANASDYIVNAPGDIHLTLSMTFPDLSQPESILPGMQLLEEEYPGAFTWMGEANLVKQALFGNGRSPVPIAALTEWAPFMEALREGISRSRFTRIWATTRTPPNTCPSCRKSCACIPTTRSSGSIWDCPGNWSIWTRQSTSRP